MPRRSRRRTACCVADVSPFDQPVQTDMASGSLRLSVIESIPVATHAM